MKKPFIYLFKTINSYYFYDVNKNETVEIDDLVYAALNKISKSENNEILFFDKDTNEKIAQLENNGYLSDNTVETVKHGCTDFLDYYLGRRLQKITLQLTQNCNLRCSYCTYSDLNNIKQRSHSSKRMTFEIGKKGIDFLIANSIDTETVNIGFYGGEPLLEFELIKKLVDYVKSEYKEKKVTYSMTTNSTLLNEDNLKFLVDNDFLLMISLDGPKNINDINRRFAVNGNGTYDIIVNNIMLIKNKYPAYFKKISISMVINPQYNFDDINSIFKNNNIFKDLKIQASMVDDTYSIEKSFYSDNYTEKARYNNFLSYLKYLNLFNDESKSIVDQSFARILSSNMRQKSQGLPKTTAPGGPCVPGQKRLFIDVHGNFFPCERVSEKSYVMNIGNLKEGFYIEKCSELLNIGSLTSEKCKKCWAFRGCRICAKHVDNNRELSGDMKVRHCKENISNFKEELMVTTMLDEAKKYYQ
jgi:CLI_3235-class bacteriocin maturation radical SAM enzyme